MSVIDLSRFNDPLSVQDAAKLLQQSEQTVRTLARKGELPYVRIGKRLYFTKSAIEEKFAGKSA